jgi:Protein of unknown function (DUF2924)
MPKRKQHRQVKPGEVFTRKFKGKNYEMAVMSTESGVTFRVRGANFPTPSAAAKFITKSSVNGWAFWKIDNR